MDLIIVAGGKGTRLGSLTLKTPKPLMQIKKQTFLEYLIFFYSQFEIKNIYLMVGYKSKQIIDKFHNKNFNGVTVTCIEEKVPLGNFGCLYQIKKKIKNDFFLYANGDSFLDTDVTNIQKKKSNFICLTKANKNDNNRLSLNKNIIKQSLKGPFKSAGLMLLSTQILRFSKNKFQNFETDILPEIIKKKKIYGKVFSSYFIDIGTRKNLNNFRKKMNKKVNAIFLDRDGTINEDKGYIYELEKLKLIKKTINFISQYKKNYKLFIITNQSGIARGIFKTDEMFNFYRKLKSKLIRKKIYIQDYQWCPHHPQGKIKKFKKKCKRRKPGNQMIEDVIKKWNINRKKSFMIGDSVSDQEAATKSKIKFFYVSELN